MQPNYFWEGQKPLSQFFSDVKANGLGMEFEFDEALLEGKADCCLLYTSICRRLCGLHSC